MALTARDGVVLTFPAEGDAPGRIITAATLEAKGEPDKGLTRAMFAGGVDFRERGPKLDRHATSATLDVGLKPGLSTIENARFRRPVVPGDTLRMEMKILKKKASVAKMAGVATVDGVVVAEAEVMCKLADKEEKAPAEVVS